MFGTMPDLTKYAEIVIGESIPRKLYPVFGAKIYH